MSGKLVNTIHGAGVINTGRKYHWWNHYNFPLVPLIETKAGDEWNAPSFHFSWLTLRVWSLNHLAIEASLSIDEGGLRLAFILPYLRIVLTLIPFPRKFMQWVYKLNRDRIVQSRHGHMN